MLKDKLSVAALLVLVQEVEAHFEQNETLSQEEWGELIRKADSHYPVRQGSDALSELLTL